MQRQREKHIPAAVAQVCIACISLPPLQQPRCTFCSPLHIHAAATVVQPPYYDTSIARLGLPASACNHSAMRTHAPLNTPVLACVRDGGVDGVAGRRHNTALLCCAGRLSQKVGEAAGRAGSRVHAGHSDDSGAGGGQVACAWPGR